MNAFQFEYSRMRRSAWLDQVLSLELLIKSGRRVTRVSMTHLKGDKQ